MIKGLRQFNEIAKGLAQLERRLPTLLGGEAVKFFKGSFRRKGFIDKTRSKWEARKTKDNTRTRKGRKSRSLMIKSGRLRRSIRVTEKTRTHVKIGTDVPYAKAHNEGEEIKQVIDITRKMRKFFWARYYATNDPMWKALALKKEPIRRTIKMPQRQFMGDSEFLRRRFEKVMEHEVKQIFKKALR